MSERRCPRGADNSKRADLRAFCGSMEGLYHLEGEVRNTGISEGFTGNVERCLYLTEGLLPQGWPVLQNFRQIFSGKVSL